MKRKLIFALPVIATLFVLASVLLSSPLTGASFNASDLIDDYTFENTGTMNVNQIDTFLNDFPKSCISWNNGFQAPDPTGYTPSNGFTYGGNVTAGQVIYDASKAYGLNPEVILTTLEKEQSLVTGDSGCSTLQYTGATGYGCPDGGTQYSYSGVDLYSIHGSEVTSVSGTCVDTSSKAGFSQQVIHAAWLLRYAEQRSQGNVGWDVQLTNSPEPGDVWDNSDDPQSCYSGPMTEGTYQVCPGGPSVFYDGYTTIDGTSTYMSDGATAALYDYTPHFSGNENFDEIFQSWFGPTTGQGFELAISDSCSSACPQYVVYDNIKQYVPDSQTLDAWGLENYTLSTIPSALLNAIPTGPNLGRLMALQGASTIYFVDGGQRYEIPYPSMYNAWNFGSQATSYVSQALFTLPSYAGYLSFDVKAPGSSTIYMLDGANNSGQTVIRPFSSQTIFNAWEGNSATYTTLDSASNYFSQIDNAIGTTLTSTYASFDGNNFQVMAGGILEEPSNIAPLFPGTIESVSGATYGRLVALGTLSSLLQASGSPTVYLMDNGTLHQILWPNALSAWEPPGQTITEVTSSYLAQFSVGSSIGGYLDNTGGQLYIMEGGTAISVPSGLDTAYGGISGSYSGSSALMALYSQSAKSATSFIEGSNSPNVYLLNNSSELEQFGWPSEVTLWGGYQSGITQLPSYIVSSIPTETYMPATFVSDGTNNYVMDNGQKWTVSSSVQSAWGLGSPQVYTDGTLSLFPTGGALGTTLQDGQGTYYMIAGGSAYATTDQNIANLWGLSSAPTHTDNLVNSLVTTYMLTRFVQSSTDGTLYAIDNGNWYSLTAAQAANLGQSGPVMILNPDLAPNSITAWTSFIVQDSSGKYYVIDGGTKRVAPNPTIINQWDDNGSISVPVMTNGFLDELPTGPQIERAIKSSDSPSIYVVVDGQKDHILYPSTYNEYYAPYTIVSDQLINALPDGPDIN